jgi:formate hydrogenlyase transcriptional activator
VKVNCAAIPGGLLESELFGHERGAFTGAMSSRAGRFELANHGTLFLDEVGELPLELQPKLLRVLQEHEFARLGSTRTLHADVRLIAATNRDLDDLVREQKFRSVLYYRLNVFPFPIPPLRERPEDIPPLVRHYVQRFSSRLGKTIDTIPPETMEVIAYADSVVLDTNQHFRPQAMLRIRISHARGLDQPEGPPRRTGPEGYPGDAA